jgi:hypothetical protein
MPVTAKLSRRFYERFGDDLTNELVDWFNSVDATYQSDLRELNEINFARFDAKLEQRLGSLDARIDGVEARLDAHIDALGARLDAKIEGVETKLMAELGRRIGVLEGNIDSRFAASEARIEQRLGDRLNAFESRMLRWMFSFWIGSMLTATGLIFAMLHK